jgi:hypothetical protein
MLSYVPQVDRLRYELLQTYFIVFAHRKLFIYFAGSLRASCSLLRKVHDRWVKVLSFHTASWRYLLAHEFPNIHNVALKSQPACFSFTFAHSWLFGVCTLSLSFTAPVTTVPVLAQMPNLTDLTLEGPQVGCDVAREVLALTKLRALSFVDVGSSLWTWLTVLSLQCIPPSCWSSLHRRGAISGSHKIAISMRCNSRRSVCPLSRHEWYRETDKPRKFTLTKRARVPSPGTGEINAHEETRLR